MTFIITLISLAIERFFHWSHLRHWRWFNTYQQWLSHSRVNRLPSLVLFILALLPFTLLVGLINHFLDNWLYGILKIVFGIVILLYCLGPANLWVQANRQNQQSIFILANERVLAVVFWFVVLGPVGAVLYRSIALMSNGSPLGLTQTAKKIQQCLDWLPIRIFTFIFALGGHFSRVFACWKKTVLKGPETNDAMLAGCGQAALDVKESEPVSADGLAEREAMIFLDRVLIISLVILAVIVLIL